MTIPRVLIDLEKNTKLLNITSKRLHLPPAIIIYSLMDISFIVVEFTQKIILYDQMEQKKAK